MTFLDSEEGSTRDLQISLKALFNVDLSDNFWLKFDDTSLIFYGIPLVNENMYVINLVAMDSCGQVCTDSIRLDVKENIYDYSRCILVTIVHHVLIFTSLSQESYSGFIYLTQREFLSPMLNKDCLYHGSINLYPLSYVRNRKYWTFSTKWQMKTGQL